MLNILNPRRRLTISSAIKNKIEIPASDVKKDRPQEIINSTISATPPAQEVLDVPANTSHLELKPTKPRKPRRLSFRQEKFCQEYVKNNGNATQAVIEVYDPPQNSTARAIASENLTKPSINNRINQILDSKGLSLDQLTLDLKNFKDNAERPVVVGKSIVYAKDDGLRLEAVKTGFKLHGVLDKAQPQAQQGDINISLNDTSSISILISKIDILSNKMGMLVEDGEIETGDRGCP